MNADQSPLERPSCHDLRISVPALNDYGSLEPLIHDLRDHRPLDLNAERWHAAHPTGTFAEWQQLARQCLLDGLHYDPGPLDLRAEVLGREQRDGFVLERVVFNTTPWIRVNGYFLLPTGVPHPGPVPGLVLFHPWGGPMLFGKDRLVDSGRDHPLLQEHRRRVFSGRYLAEQFARRGSTATPRPSRTVTTPTFSARPWPGSIGISVTNDQRETSVEDRFALPKEEESKW